MRENYTVGKEERERKGDFDRERLKERYIEREGETERGEEKGRESSRYAHIPNTVFCLVEAI